LKTLGTTTQTTNPEIVRISSSRTEPNTQTTLPSSLTYLPTDFRTTGKESP